PISDYVLNSAAPPGVFVVATHEDNLGKKLATYKMGDGPYYLLHRPYHLCFFEIPKTIFRVLEGRQPLLDNSPAPRTSVAAVAKRSLSADNVIKRGIGSFDVRGEAVTIVEQPDHVPIGLLDCAFLKHDIEPGQRITFADVDLPDSLALTIWREIHQRVGQAV
ncbi:MAG: NAD(P)-dependent oxidoreductase, partial [Candidatus Promineifilaceae bacterium]